MKDPQHAPTLPAELPPFLLLDTSVWRDAAEGSIVIRDLRERGAQIRIAHEAVVELVAQALEATNDHAYGQAHRACQIAASTAVAFSPAAHHLARRIGMRVAQPPDPLEACRAVAASLDSYELARVAERSFPMGNGESATLSRWPTLMRKEKAHWLESILKAIERAGPEVVQALRSRRRRRLTQSELEQARRDLHWDRIHLLEIEWRSMQAVADTSPYPVASFMDILQTLDAELSVFTRIFTEAILDSVDHPGNANRRSVRIEENDFYDLMQLRYLSRDCVWVTAERAWPALAAQAGLGERLVRSADL